MLTAVQRLGAKRADAIRGYAGGGFIEDLTRRLTAAPVVAVTPTTSKPPVAPLGTGAAAAARGAIQTRGQKLLDAEKEAVGMAKGGPIKGKSPSATADNIPIMATAGEFMIKKKAADHLGQAVLHALNTSADGAKALNKPSPKLGAVRKMAMGGPVVDSLAERAIREYQQRNPPLPPSARAPVAPNFTTTLGAGAASNAIPYVNPPAPLNATTSLGAAAVRAPVAPPVATTPYSGDPMNPSAQGPARTPAPTPAQTPPRPIVGGPTIPGTAPPAPSQVRRGTAFTVAEPPRAPSFAAQAMGAVRNSAGPALGAAALIPEQMDVARVAANPNASGLDVATQQAQGLGRYGAAAAGAATGGALGMMTGLAAPVLAPLGAIAGGAYGYYAANKAIEGGRNIAGTDPRAPVDRLPVAPAAAPAPAAVAAPAPYPENARVRAAGTPAGAIPQAAADPQAGGNVTRVGNSYSGAPGIAGDITINGKGPTGGAISAQNNAAADALAARYGQTSGFGVATRGTGTVSSMDTSQGYAQDQRDLARLDAVKQPDPIKDLMNNGRRMGPKKAGAIAELQRVAADTADRADARKLGRDKFAMEATGAALDNTAKTRLGALQDKVLTAKTPAEQVSAEDKLRAFQGKYEKPSVDNYGYAPGGQTVDANGQVTTLPGVIFNKQTGEVKQSAGAAKPAQNFEVGKTYSDAKGNKAKWDGQKFVPL